MFVRRDITEARHCNDILDLSAGHMQALLVIYRVFILIQDNARTHTAQVFMTFLDDRCISVMNWLARSPYHNPIEHSRRVQAQNELCAKTKKSSFRWFLHAMY